MAKKINNVENYSLSKSILWEQMNQYYQDLGPEAWEKDLVPYQVTSNKLLAHFYATLIITAIYDHIKSAPTNLENSEPYYILELGAGHGKFSFYMCKFLEDLNLEHKLNIVYIASDISEKNIGSWQQHPKLQKYLQTQKLDFAKFNAETDQELVLINTNKTIKINSLNNSLFVIANYVFDTLLHDAFKCKNNKLFISTISIDQKKKFTLKNFKYKYSYSLTDPNYYQEKTFNKILSEYQQNLKQGVFLLPIGGLQAIQNIKKFSNKDTIFLIADKGNIKLEDFNTQDDPSIAKHGSISFMVNFHALTRFFDLTKGCSLINYNPYTDLQIGCFISKNETNYQLLKFTMQQILENINPIYTINLCYANHKTSMWNNLDQILSIMTMSRWDPDLFYDLSGQLLHFIEKSLKKGNLNTEQEDHILQGLKSITDYFFKLEKHQDLPFIIANIYYALEKFSLAIKFFELSIEEFGESAESWYNLGLCYKEMGKVNLCKKSINKALQIKPNYMLAKKLLLEI